MELCTSRFVDGNNHDVANIKVKSAIVMTSFVLTLDKVFSKIRCTLFSQD